MTHNRRGFFARIAAFCAAPILSKLPAPVPEPEPEPETVGLDDPVCPTREVEASPVGDVVWAQHTDHGVVRVWAGSGSASECYRSEYRWRRRNLNYSVRVNGEHHEAYECAFVETDACVARLYGDASAYRLEQERAVVGDDVVDFILEQRAQHQRYAQRVTVRTGLPRVSWRRLNEGV